MAAGHESWPDNRGIIYQEYTGKFPLKSSKSMQPCNKTVMEANWGICTAAQVG